MTEKVSNTHITMGRWMKSVIKTQELVRKIVTHLLHHDKEIDHLKDRISKLEKQPSLEGDQILKYFQQVNDKMTEIYHRTPKIKELHDGAIEIEIPGEEIDASETKRTV